MKLLILATPGDVGREKGLCFYLKGWLDLFFVLLDSTSICSFKSLAVCLLHPSCPAWSGCTSKPPGVCCLLLKRQQGLSADCTGNYSKNDWTCVCYVEHTSVYLACSSEPDLIQSFLTHGIRIALRVFFNWALFLLAAIKMTLKYIAVQVLCFTAFQQPNTRLMRIQESHSDYSPVRHDQVCVCLIKQGEKMV